GKEKLPLPLAIVRLRTPLEKLPRAMPSRRRQAVATGEAAVTGEDEVDHFGFLITGDDSGHHLSSN
ncbi:hypothetical protein PanWU01x14_118170, partial [Parasponia andersonii]